MGSEHSNLITHEQERKLLLTMIEHLEPKKEMYAGIRFLHKLLEERGVEECVSFLDKATKALSEEDGLDLAFDFTAEEKAIFDRAAINFLTRRNFLHTAGWAIPGMVTFSHAGVSIAHKLMDGSDRQPTYMSGVEKAEKMIEHYVLPPSELLIGAALMNEGYEKYLEIKLEQIADAVSQLADQIREKENIRSRA